MSRLIDADALKVDYLFPTTTTGTKCYQYVSMEQIQNALTIEPEPCEDAVSREAMRDEIDKLIKIHFDRSVVLTKAKQALFNLPSVTPKQRWIPCKTALPEKGQYVLCQCRAGIMDVLHLTDDNGWYKDSTHIYMHGFVLAWMPLPDPWKGEQDEA